MALGHNQSAGMGKDFESFLQKSLKTLNKHETVNESFRSKDTGGVSYSVILSKTKDTPLILYMENSAHQAAAVFSDATPYQLLAPGSKILRDALSRVGVVVHEHEVPSTSTGLLLAQNDAIISSIQGIRYGENISKSPELFLRREETIEEQGLPSPCRDLLPIQVGHRNPSIYSHFNFARYFSRLSTNRLGQICLHVPVATTTIDIMSSLCDAIPSLDGAVVIANQQISGQGRGGNEFVSPLGAAMFTFSMEIPRNSTVAKEAGFVQHILAVAICDAVRSLSGVDDFPLRIKWPNDLYYNRSHKMGGILAKAKSGDYKMSFQLSARINVTNSQPTCCLNDIIPQYRDVKFTTEDVIAETLNKFEAWLDSYQLHGRNEFLKKYYEFWLHDREEVVLEAGEKVIIRGLDENGFLQVDGELNPGTCIRILYNRDLHKQTEEERTDSIILILWNYLYRDPGKTIDFFILYIFFFLATCACIYGGYSATHKLIRDKGSDVEHHQFKNDERTNLEISVEYLALVFASLFGAFFSIFVFRNRWCSLLFAVMGSMATAICCFLTIFSDSNGDLLIAYLATDFGIFISLISIWTNTQYDPNDHEPEIEIPIHEKMCIDYLYRHIVSAIRKHRNTLSDNYAVSDARSSDNSSLSEPDSEDDSDENFEVSPTQANDSDTEDVSSLLQNSPCEKELE